MLSNTRSQSIRIGCAGWSIPAQHASLFPPGGSHLERYAARFPAVEINSTFYRPHLPATYSRWAESVPQDFRFSVKVPRQVTHTSRLADLEALGHFLAQVGALGGKLGPLLVQLPPSLAFTPDTVSKFFRAFRERFSGLVVCEPRHASWFSPDAERLLTEFQVARAAADPALNQQAAGPGGWDRLAYYRLHGAPRMYYSTYSEDYLDNLAHSLSAAAVTAEVWCIFDNTVEGAATINALGLLELVS